MKTITMTLAAAMGLAGCIPTVRLTVETHDPQGSVIERADVTNSDTTGRTFTANSGGSVVLTATASYTDGLDAMDIEGGFSCNKIAGGVGTTQQGTISSPDPNLPGSHPTTSSLTVQSPIQCVGGTYQSTVMACATASKGGGRSCTQSATLKSN